MRWPTKSDANLHCLRRPFLPALCAHPEVAHSRFAGVRGHGVCRPHSLVTGIGTGIGPGLLALPVLAGSSAYAMAGAFKWKNSLERPPMRAKGFYGIIAISTLIGIADGALYQHVRLNAARVVPDRVRHRRPVKGLQRRRPLGRMSVRPRLWCRHRRYATNRHCDAGVRVSMLRPRFRWSSISAAQPSMRGYRKIVNATVSNAFSEKAPL
jgi:hypothetical protein